MSAATTTTTTTTTHTPITHKIIDMNGIIQKMSSIEALLKSMTDDIEKQLKHTNSSGADHYRLLEMRKGIWALLQNNALLVLSNK